MSDIFDKHGVDDGQVSDYPEMWKPHHDDEDREVMVGILCRLHDEPDAWLDNPQTDTPRTIYTILSVGESQESDFTAGMCRSAPLHSQLIDSTIQSAEIGDLVRIEYEGSEPSGDYTQYLYDVSVVPQSKWSDSRHKKEFEAIIDEHKSDGGWWGDDRDIAPSVSGSQSSGFNTADDMTDDKARTDGGSATGPFKMVDGASSRDESVKNTEDMRRDAERSDVDSDDLVESVEFVADIVDMHGGEIHIDTVSPIYNDVRGFDTQLVDALELAGLSLGDGGMIRRQ